MDRRTFLFVFSLGALSAPLGADAQQAGKVHRIGYLSGGSSTGASHLGEAFSEAFRQGLRELGWIEGQNIVIDYRFAEGRFDRLPDLAAELVGLKADIIVASPTPPAVAAKNATATIPIVVVAVGEPVGLGLIASLARPGGNVTGLAYGVGLGLFSKQLELLKETRPQGPPCSNPLEPRPSGPRALDKRRESHRRTVGIAASAPGGPRSHRVRRRLRSDGQ